MIGRDDRIAAVLRRDPSLVEVLAGLSPTLARLRVPALGRVMCRLITVEQAARLGGVPAEALMGALNRALDTSSSGGHEMTHTRARARSDSSGFPEELSSIEPAKIVAVDVRDELRGGKEPFSLIMAARGRVPPGGGLSVRAIFEPVPLYSVMAKQGFLHHTEQLGEDDWRVWFYPGGQPWPQPGPDRGSVVAAGGPDEAPGLVVLDVRDMEAPEPMVRTLAALEHLPAGGVLLQINRRVPQFLLPQLEARGYQYELREQAPDLVRVLIRRQAENPVQPQAGDSVMKVERTLDVRVIPPREKHPTIFETFAALGPGESFMLLNDHDPRPLRYEFEAEHKDEFEWQYLEEGPSVWRVRISRPAR